jgi:hypothetical protein
MEKPDVAAETLGHIDMKDYTDRVSDKLADQGATQDAAKLQDNLYDTMSARTVRGRKVLNSVLQEIKKRRDNYDNKNGGGGSSARAATTKAETEKAGKR